jgi:hypothetical protein
MNTKEYATDAEEQSTPCETHGIPDTSLTEPVGGQMTGTTSVPSIRAVTLATQLRWAIRWRQRLREFDSAI